MHIFLILVICHFASDFGLQLFGIGSKKMGLNRYMLAHILIISLFFFVPAAFYFPLREVVVATSFIFLTHISVDIVKAWIYKKYKISPPLQSFWVILGIDQSLHISAIYGSLTYLLK